MIGIRLGPRIKKVRKLKQIAQVDLEKKTGIKREYLSKIENEELKNPTIKTLAKIAEGLDISLTELIEPDYEPHARRSPDLQVLTCRPEDQRLKAGIERGIFVAVPRISLATAALGLGYLEDSQIEEFIIIPAQYLEPTQDNNRYRCIKTEPGDLSMLPLIKPGAILGIDSASQNIEQLNNKVVLLKPEGEENCLVRRLLLQRNYILALPENMAEYDPIVITSFRRRVILGQVIWILQMVS